MIAFILKLFAEILLEPIVLLAILIAAYCFLFVPKNDPFCVDAIRKYENTREFCISIQYRNDQPMCQKLSDLHDEVKRYECGRNNFEKGMDKLLYLLYPNRK